VAAFVNNLRAEAAAECIRVSAAATDPAIDLVPGEETAWLNHGAKARGELLIFITGTGGRQGPAAFLRAAADLGYHVIAPLYVNDVAAAVCRDDTNPNAFENFRREIIEGRDLSPRVDVNRANSLENRIVKLLGWLAQRRPKEGWGQFLDERGELRWRKTVLAGHSQGGGHALLMAQDHEVARVIATGAPKDYSQTLKRPAGWYRPGRTPVERMFAFVHEQDAQACTFAQQRENFRALGLVPIANVDGREPPYGGARALTTNLPGGHLESPQAHSAVILDWVKDADGSPHFKPVWVHMLTAPVP
jgi:pimeloyl-ACP methyl ester carboxylesterase